MTAQQKLPALLQAGSRHHSRVLTQPLKHTALPDHLLLSKPAQRCAAAASPVLQPPLQNSECCLLETVSWPASSPIQTLNRSVNPASGLAIVVLLFSSNSSVARAATDVLSCLSMQVSCGGSGPSSLAEGTAQKLLTFCWACICTLDPRCCAAPSCTRCSMAT